MDSYKEERITKALKARVNDSIRKREQKAELDKLYNGNKAQHIKKMAEENMEATKKFMEENKPYSPSGKKFRPSGDRGFTHEQMHKAAEELRMEGKGSTDPMYHDSKKNK